MNSQNFYSTLRACLAALLLTVTLGVGAAPVAQAIWCSGNTTLYFTHDELYAVGNEYKGQTITTVWSGDKVTATTYQPDWDYDSSVRGNCTHVVFDPSFANVRPVSCIDWFLDFTKLTAIEGLTNLNTSEVTSMYDMFANCSSLTSIDLSGFRTAEVTTMEGMFYSCDGLTTLDLSTFRTDKVKNMVEMFKDCTSLATIYVNSGWTTDNVTSSSDMFTNCKTSTLTTQAPTVVLNDNADNAAEIAYFNGITTNVQLKDRTLYKDGEWNTLCLPFNVTISSSPLAGAALKELVVGQSNLAADGKLTLTFKDATNIVAGKPYLIKWESGDNIVNPVFNGVTITSVAPTPVTFDNAQGSGDCSFVGQYDPFVIDEGNQNSIVMLSSGNRIGYSNNVPRTLRCMRAHFEIPATGGAPAMTDYAIDFDGEASTALKVIDNGQWVIDNVYYDLAGRRVAQPTKGLYIFNGKKVMIP